MYKVQGTPALQGKPDWHWRDYLHMLRRPTFAFIEREEMGMLCLIFSLSASSTILGFKMKVQ